MTTKEQERKALAQIKKIVEGLGDGSYIGMAFEGCFEDAETNIENDWGCSMKQRAESAERKLEEAINARKSEAMMADTQRKQVASLKAQVNKLTEKNGYQLATIKAMEQEAKQEQEKTDKAVMDLSNKLIEKQNELEAAQLEIIRLKARLFDLIDNQ